MQDRQQLQDRVKTRPGGYFIAPEGEERVGHVSNVVFCKGWIAEDGYRSAASVVNLQGIIDRNRRFMGKGDG